MIISRDLPEDAMLCVDDMLIKRVKIFEYLGTTINDQWNLQYEIKHHSPLPSFCEIQTPPSFVTKT